jgi:hypothetical protein
MERTLRYFSLREAIVLTAYAPGILAWALRESALGRTWQHDVRDFSALLATMRLFPGARLPGLGDSLVSDSPAVLDPILNQRVPGLDAYFAKAPAGIGIITSTMQQVDIGPVAGKARVRRHFRDGRYGFSLVKGRHVQVYDLLRRIPSAVPLPPYTPRAYRQPVACLEVEGGILWLTAARRPTDPKVEPHATDLELLDQAQAILDEVSLYKPSNRWGGVLVPDIAFSDTLVLDWLAGARRGSDSKALQLVGAFQTLDITVSSTAAIEVDPPKTRPGEPGAVLSFDSPSLMFKTNAAGCVEWLVHTNEQDWIVYNG